MGVRQAVAWRHDSPTRTARETPVDAPWRSTACGPLIFCAVPRVFYTQTSLAEYTYLCYLDVHRGGGRYGSHEYRFG